jgi:prophage maintenance system killer protein
VIPLALTDVLAVAARVVACDSMTIVDRTDLEAVELTLAETKAAAAGGDLADAAAALLAGLVRGRPFQGPHRRIAVAVTLHQLALNDRDLDLEPVTEMDQLLDRIAAGASLQETAVDLRVRLRRRGACPAGSFATERWHATEDPVFWTEERGLSTEEKEPTMFERFTDRARRVVVLAQEEARLLSHNYIGTEHILLGLIHEGEGVAAKALESLGVSLEAVRVKVEEIIGEGQQAPSGHIPFTPRANKVLELSKREALQLGHNYIGTEHILLGLIREGEGVAAQVLVQLGADLGRVRQQVIQLLSGYQGKETAKADAPAEAAAARPRSARATLILQELNAELDESARLRAGNDRLLTEVTRLRDLLRRHGIDPDTGESARSAS